MADREEHTKELAREARKALDRSDLEQAKRYLDQIDRALGGKTQGENYTKAQQAERQQAEADANKKG